MMQKVVGSLSSLRLDRKLTLKYSKIPLLRPPFGLPKSGFISKVVLIANIKL